MKRKILLITLSVLICFTGCGKGGGTTKTSNSCTSEVSKGNNSVSDILGKALTGYNESISTGLSAEVDIIDSKSNNRTSKYFGIDRDDNAYLWSEKDKVVGYVLDKKAPLLTINNGGSKLFAEVPAGKLTVNSKELDTNITSELNKYIVLCKEKDNRGLSIEETNDSYIVSYDILYSDIKDMLPKKYKFEDILKVGDARLYITKDTHLLYKGGMTYLKALTGGTSSIVPYNTEFRLTYENISTDSIRDTSSEVSYSALKDMYDSLLKDSRNKRGGK